MSSYKRYRIFKKDGTYEIAVSKNRFDAIKEVKEKYNLTDEDLKSISIVSSKNVRSFKI